MPSNPSLSAIPASAAVKRKNAPRADEDDSGDDSDSDASMINVDFDFYSFNPDVDLIAVKRLLRQTLSHDDNQLDVHPLAELILSEGVRMGAGSTIKTEGEESDPWAMVAAIDINRNRANPAFVPFLDYLRSTIPSHSPLRLILDPIGPATANSPALIFSLRLLNLPLPLIPPLYRMLGSELEDGRREGRDVPDFTHYLVWGRGYRLEGNEEAMGLEMDGTTNVSGGKKKKSKGGTTKPIVPMQAGTFPYHPEEEFLDQVASLVHTYPLKSAPQREDDSFGVEQHGRLVLLDAVKMRNAITAMEEACKQ